jgi:hypothetical protein
MKMLPQACLVLLSAVAIGVCGEPHPAHVSALAPVSETRLYPASADAGLPAEAIAAAGLGGLDGATLVIDTGENAMPEGVRGTVLTRNEARGGK